MMINPHEINRSSRMMVEQRRQEADEYRLATIALGQPERAERVQQPRGWVSQLVSGLRNRLRMVWLGVSGLI